MKLLNFFIAIIVITITNNFSAKSISEIDSLLSELKISTQDTNKVLLYQHIAEIYSRNLEYNNAHKYTVKGLELSRKLKFKRGTVIHLMNASGYYVRRQNQTKALELIFEAYKIAQKENLQFEQLQALTGISFTYTSFNNYREAYNYKFKLWKKYESLINNPTYRNNNFENLNRDSLKLSQTIATLSFYSLKLNELDNAFFYGRKALKYAESITQKDASFLAYPLNCIGIAYRLSNMPDSAMFMFRESIKQSQLSKIKKNKITNLYKSNWEIAIVFKDLNNIDSSNYYAESALDLCSQLKWDKDMLDIQSLLAQNYSGIDDQKALHYYQKSSTLRDSLYNHEKILQLENLTFMEKERQKEIDYQLKLQAERYYKLINYSLIAAGVLAFIILFLALSRSIITGKRINTFLATLAIMMVFKFSSMLLDPYIESKISKNPATLFFVTIIIAAILSPVLDGIKNWLKRKMLAKAKSHINKTADTINPDL